MYRQPIVKYHSLITDAAGAVYTEPVKVNGAILTGQRLSPVTVFYEYSLDGVYFEQESSLVSGNVTKLSDRTVWYRLRVDADGAGPREANAFISILPRGRNRPGDVVVRTTTLTSSAGGQVNATPIQIGGAMFSVQTIRPAAAPSLAGVEHSIDGIHFAGSTNGTSALSTSTVNPIWVRPYVATDAAAPREYTVMLAVFKDEYIEG